MSAFGFSTGDFVTATQLIYKITLALNDSKGASAEFQNLKKQLEWSQKVLRSVENVLQKEQGAVVQEIQRSTSQFIDTIRVFAAEHIDKYERHLQQGGSGSSALTRIKDGCAKVKWSVWKKEELDKFQTRVQTELQLIEVQLITYQANASSVQYQTLSTNVQNTTRMIFTGFLFLVRAMNRSLNDVAEALTKKFEKHHDQQMEAIAQLQLLVTRIPSQVPFQEPVYLFGLCGKCRPLHLDFVQSWDAFLYVVTDVEKREGNANYDLVNRVFNGESIAPVEFKDTEGSHVKELRFIHTAWNDIFSPGKRINIEMSWFRGIEVIEGEYSLDDLNSFFGEHNIQFEDYNAPDRGKYLVRAAVISPDHGDGRIMITPDRGDDLMWLF